MTKRCHTKTYDGKIRRKMQKEIIQRGFGTGRNWRNGIRNQIDGWWKTWWFVVLKLDETNDARTITWRMILEQILNDWRLTGKWSMAKVATRFLNVDFWSQFLKLKLHLPTTRVCLDTNVGRKTISRDNVANIPNGRIANWKIAISRQQDYVLEGDWMNTGELWWMDRPNLQKSKHNARILMIGQKQRQNQRNVRKKIKFQRVKCRDGRTGTSINQKKTLSGQTSRTRRKFAHKKKKRPERPNQHVQNFQIEAECGKAGLKFRDDVENSKYVRRKAKCKLGGELIPFHDKI